MATQYPHLVKSGKKEICPQCFSFKKTFVRYIDQTGELLPEIYGRCDREEKCGYHEKPPSGTPCYFVPFDELKEVNEKSVWVKQNGREQYFPKVAVLEYAKAGLFVTEYFLTDKKGKQRTPLQVKFDSGSLKYIKAHSNTFIPQNPKPPQPTQETVYIDFSTFTATLRPELYEKNNFIQNLFNRVQFPFEVLEVTKVVELYRLGTIESGYKSGAVTFPYIDTSGNVRAVQVKQFDQDNHTTGTTFLHSIVEQSLKQSGEQLPEWLQAYNQQSKKVSCLFGEHLLSKFPSNPIALVEAPKTAIYGTLYFGLPETPDSLVWLAVYNKSSFSFEKLKALEGRFVYVFPDLSKNGTTFKEWQAKAKEFEKLLPKTKFVFSELLEQKAPEHDKGEGLDLADYLIKQDWRLFRRARKPHDLLTPEPIRSEAGEQSEAPKRTFFSPQRQTVIEPLERAPKPLPENWELDISELENYFSRKELPTQPIRLNGCSTILNCSLFIESHFANVKANNGKRAFLPYLHRLKELKAILTANT